MMGATKRPASWWSGFWHRINAQAIRYGLLDPATPPEVRQALLVSMLFVPALLVLAVVVVAEGVLD